MRTYRKRWRGAAIVTAVFTFGALGAVGLAAYTPQQIAKACTERPNTPACKAWWEAACKKFSCASTTTRPSTTTTTTSPSGDPKPLGPSGTYVLQWRDEFSGTTLDTTKWTNGWFPSSSTQRYTNPVNSSMDFCYDRQNVVVGGGVVELKAHPNSDSACRTRSGSTAPAAGGLIVTDNKFQRATGVWEARVKYQGPDEVCGSGSDVVYNWPAFWLNGDDWPQQGEIDAFETGSNGFPRWNVHSSVNGSDTDQPRSGPSICGQGWHTITVKRTAADVCFWFDGVSKGCTTDAARFAGFSHYTLLENAGDTDRTYTNLNSSAWFDYVRYWAL